jgi:hypothetical protein
MVNLSVERGGWWTTTDTGMGEDWLDGVYSVGEGIHAKRYYYAGKYPGPKNTAWYCETTLALCHANPAVMAYFVNAKTLPTLNNAGDTQMIANDYMELWVNGKFIFNAILEQNMSVTSDPIPLTVRANGNDVYLLDGVPISVGPIDNDALFAGLNVFAIKAMDGYYNYDCGNADAVAVPGSTTCFLPTSRVGQYLYIYTPEPATWGLFGLGALLLAWRRKAR